MEKLALEIFDRDGGGSKFAFLPSDTSITITDTSEIFDSGDVWTYSFKLNIYDNAHIFGTAGEMHGSRLHEQVNKRRARLWVLGLPLYYGYLRLDDEVDVEDDGTVDVKFESGQKTFQDMIEGAKANQVPLKDDVFIGMALDQKRTVKRKNCALDIWSTSLLDSEYWGGYLSVIVEGVIMRGKENMAQQFPKYVRPFGNYTRVSNGVGESVPAGVINKDHPYDATHFYCNTSICYVLRQLNTETGEVEKVRDYRVSYPKRINPAPNFFVLYWLDCLMKHLDIHVSENQMLGVEDLRRLFFANAKCGVKTKDDVAYTANEPIPFGDVGGKGFIPSEDYNKRNLSINFLNREAPDDVKATLYYVGEQFDDDNPVWHKAYATSENFPDVEIKDVIEAVKNGFGVRMLFNRDYTRVRIVLLRDVLGSQEVHEVTCEVKEVTKQENSIRGFRLTYGAGEEDTNYFYRGFANKLTHQAERWPDTSDTHDYSHWNTSLHYDRIKLEVSTLNKTCYIDMATGNAYIVKIDEDFKDAGDEAYPALFECAGFMDAEDGDCTGEIETIKEIRVGFSPTIMNIMSSGGYALFVNEDMGLPGLNLNDVEPSNHPGAVVVSQAGYETFGNECIIPKYDAYRRAGLFGVATETWVDFVDLQDNPVIEIPLSATETWRFTVSGTVKEGYLLYLADNYDINDEMTAPIETHDFGLTLGIMRGSGSDAYIYSSYDNIESEGNNTWEVVPGSGAYAHADTCDDYGNPWAYMAEKVQTNQETANYIQRCYELCPNSNVNFDQGKPLYFENLGRAVTFGGLRVTMAVWFGGYSEPWGYTTMSTDEKAQWTSMMKNALPGTPTIADIYEWDRNNDKRIAYIAPVTTAGELQTAHQIIIELNSLQVSAFGQGGNSYNPATYEFRMLDRYKNGLVSLKLRAEKPNPYYVPVVPDIIRNKKEAGEAMTMLYTTSDADLLNRQKVRNEDMRAAGWNAPGDGYATVYSMGYGVQLSDGKVHEILWTPIKPNGDVKTQQQLQSYIQTFNGKSLGQIKTLDTEHLVLDIDTTEERAQILHELQAMYYAEAGESVAPVDVSGINKRYLEITNPDLRHRGLADQFYKEYSYWVRNARIAKMTVHMELAQLVSIDKTVRQRIGDITGFVKKMQYSIDMQSGLSDVTVEMWYL